MTPRRPEGGDALMPTAGRCPETRGTEVSKRFIVLAAGAATLAAAPVALSHPSTIEFTARTACTANNACTTQTQYVILEHGYVTVLKEDNGQTSRGVLNLKNLPSARRSGLAKAGWFTALTNGESLPLSGGRTGSADTGAQAHATCTGVTALESGNATGDANVLAWQASHSNNDPFFNYVPWQATASGLDDDEEIDDWLAVGNAVLAAASRPERLSTTSTVAQFTTACTALGGTYRAADGTVTSVASASSGVVADAVAPLNAQIAELKAEVAKKVSELAGRTADHLAALMRGQAFTVEFASGTLSRAAIARDGIRVVVSGPHGEVARVDVRVASSIAERLGIPQHIGSVVGTPGASGKVTLTIRPGKGALRALRASDGSAPLLAEVRAARKPGTDRATLAG